MIIDTHVHYWERSTPARPHAPDGLIWGEELLAEDLLDRAGEAGVDKIVQVTASLMGWDNRYSLEAAEAHPDKVVGVFGRFDPLAPGVDDRLAEMMAHPRMIGVRITLHQPPYDTWLNEGLLEPFLKAVERQSAPLEVFAPFQPTELRDMARRYPGIQIMVDHCTTRLLKTRPDRFVLWPEALRLAEEPNIWMKASGFPEASPEGEPYPFPTSQERFRQLYEHVGARRMLWGSNYPPVMRVCSYAEAVAFVRDECDFIPREDRNRILGPNFLTYMTAATGHALA